MLTVGEQLTETLLAHRKLSKRQARREAVALLEKVGISEAEKRLDEYPFQFSGGMCQRVMIAMALALSPDVLIADEPTTALDVTIQAQILALIKQLQRQSGMSAVFITHNLAVVSGIADDVLVLYAGLCMELAPAAQLFENPFHPYTQGLLSSLASVHKKEDVLPVITGHPPVPGQILTGCPFAPRCPHAFDKCRRECPPLLKKPPAGPAVGSGRGNDGSRRNQTSFKTYTRRRWFGKNAEKAVLKDVSLTLAEDHVLGLVGESGCGKSTLCKVLLGIEKPLPAW